MSYSPEQLARLRHLIRDHLDKNRVFDRVREMVEREAISEALASDRILQALSNEGVLSQVLEHVQEVDERGDPAEPSKNYLMFKLQGGKAFVDFMQPERTGRLQVCASFLDQRYISKKVPCSVEPEFDDQFLFTLAPPEATSVDFATLMKLRAAIHLTVIFETEGRREVLATRSVEWRVMLSTASLNFPVELTGTGTRGKITVGVLYFQADIMPRKARSLLITDRLVNEQLSLEKKRERDVTHSFFEYANEWWQDYKQIRPSHEKRLVKIYAETEDGSYKAVSALVQPLKANRMLDSPLQAARFVSLFPLEREETPGGTRNEVWYNMHTFMSRGAGDCEDHAVLLASLLLGFGLDAYVCVGTSGEGPHAWVFTRGGEKPMFWESLTGMRMPIDDPRVHRMFFKIACVFNYKAFYANTQVVDVVSSVNWDLDDDTAWKAMDPEMISGLLPAPRYLPLAPPRPDTHLLEAEMELKLREHLTAYRNRLDLMSIWDNDLSYLLSPALYNYELERVGSVTFGRDEFQQSIKNHVPQGHTFKAYPAQFAHNDCTKITASLTQAAVAQDILSTRGDTVRFALRIKVVSYPEDRLAVWLMLAVRYRTVT
jgi:centrosomal protein CEP76